MVGHLIHGEATDWIERARIIPEVGETRTLVLNMVSTYDGFGGSEALLVKSDQGL